MNSNNDINRAYELIERYEFAELGESDKEFVLSVMPESQYCEMRKTVRNVSACLEKDIEPVINVPELPGKDHTGKWIRILNYPIQLYKVAVSIILILFAYLLLQRINSTKETELIASNDTVIIYHTDTVFTRASDPGTVSAESAGIVSEKRSNPAAHMNPGRALDCKNVLCPGEADRLKNLENKNSLSNDSSLKDMLVLLTDI